MAMIVEESTQNVNSNAGIIFSKQILDGIPSFGKFDGCQPSLKSISCQSYANSAVAKAAVTLMTLGKASFCDIAAHQRDDLFSDAVGGAVPSEATFRQRLDYIAGLPGVRQWVDDANAELLAKVEDFGAVRSASGDYVPLDIDVSVMVNDDCRKEGIGFTYHRVEGYAPIFCTIGRFGYQLANELRPGSQHSQKDFPAFLRRCVAIARPICRGSLLVRLDSAHDADETLATGFELDDEIRRAVEGSGLSFIVKRNARREDARTWIEQANGEHAEPSYSYVEADGARVDVFRGVVSHVRTRGTADRPLFCVWEVRRTARDGELFPEHAVATWWTNLPDDADTVVRLYHDHATCEQFHSELKSDMGVERLPSGKFRTNELVLALSALAFNVLRRIGQAALASGGGLAAGRGDRLRLRTVMLGLMYVAAVVGSHAGVRRLRLGRNCGVADTFIDVFRRLAA